MLMVLCCSARQSNVPFQRNRVTKLTGAMYTNEALSGTFQIETAWLDEYNANF